MIEPPDTHERHSTCRRRSSSASLARTPIWNRDARNPPPDSAKPILPATTEVTAVKLPPRNCRKTFSALEELASPRASRERSAAGSSVASCRAVVSHSQSGTDGSFAAWPSHVPAWSYSPRPKCASPIVTRNHHCVLSQDPFRSSANGGSVV